MTSGVVGESMREGGPPYSRTPHTGTFLAPIVLAFGHMSFYSK